MHKNNHHHHQHNGDSILDAAYLSRIAIVVIAVIVASLVTRRGMKMGTSYSMMKKSPYQPPNMWFGIIWSLLYLGIVVSWALCTREFRHDSDLLRESDNIHIFALLINVLWCVLFFGFGLITLSGILLIGIVIFAVYTALRLRYLILSVDDSSPFAANYVLIYWLLYTAWCSFATFLNFTTSY